jgi:hypothetical protein
MTDEIFTGQHRNDNNSNSLINAPLVYKFQGFTIARCLSYIAAYDVILALSCAIGFFSSRSKRE